MPPHVSDQFNDVNLHGLTFTDGDLLLEPLALKPHAVHLVPTYFFRMTHAITGDQLGRINLRTESTEHVVRYAGHIGFEVQPAHRGHHYAARALRLLLPLAHRLGIDPLSITCDPDNLASRRTCELAGAKLLEVVDVPATCIIHKAGHPRKCRYLLSTTIAS